MPDGEPPRRATDAELASRFARPLDEVERGARETAMRFGVNPDLPPRERFHACLKRAKKTAKPHPQRCRWEVLREALAGKRNDLEVLVAAEALRLTPEEALRRAAEGWDENGAPKVREPGQDDEERVA